MKVMSFKQPRENTVEELAAYLAYEPTLEDRYEMAAYRAEQWEVMHGNLGATERSLESTVNQRQAHADTFVRKAA